MEGSSAKLAEKDKQIKELKGQRDAIFEEMHSGASGSTAKKETMMPNMIHGHSASSSGFVATPVSGVRTMNKFQQSLLKGAASMSKRSMELRSPDRARAAVKYHERTGSGIAGDWASPMSNK